MFRVTAKVGDGLELCIVTDTQFKRAMAAFRVLDVEMPRDTIIRFYLENGELLRQWFSGRDVNLLAS